MSLSNWNPALGNPELGLYLSAIVSDALSHTVTVLDKIQNFGKSNKNTFGSVDLPKERILTDNHRRYRN